MILIGELSLWVALVMAAWGCAVSFAGGATGHRELLESGYRGIYATFALTLVAATGLLAGLLTHDFSVGHVAAHTSLAMPHVYAVAAFWAGPAGAMLFLTVLLSGCAALAVRATRSMDGVAAPYAAGTLGALLLVFVAATVFEAVPFARLEWRPPDGHGLNPLLQSSGMLVHPPALFLGYSLAAVPFAIAVAGLLVGRIGARWLLVMRRWSLASWFFITLGMILGMRWSYVLGWPAGWAGDPARSAALLPWLACTSFLLSTMVHERRGALGRWNLVLGASTFLLAMFGAFIARGGVIGIASSFATSPLRGWFATFLVVATAMTVYLTAMRLRGVAESAPAAATVRPGARGQKYAGYGAIAGAAMLAAALAGTALATKNEVTLRTGETHEATDPFGRRWRFVSLGVSRFESLNADVIAVSVDAWRGANRQGLVSPEQRRYFDARRRPTFDVTTVPGIRSSAMLDIYVEIIRVRDDAVDLRIAFNPLVMWAWIGGAFMALGGLVLMWPRRSAT